MHFRQQVEEDSRCWKTKAEGGAGWGVGVSACGPAVYACVHLCEQSACMHTCNHKLAAEQISSAN